MLTKQMIKTSFMPMPSNLSFWWNMGSLLGLCLVTQIISGIFLSMFYDNNSIMSFNSINHINRDINLGWLIRFIHANGASMFFVLIYLHIGRNIYFKSYTLSYVWLSGVMILLLLFMTSFLGYVLPWGQMSYWGATVITNLVSSIPYMGNMLTNWLWGNFSVSGPTLTRFFSLHFLLPFLIMTMSTFHIIFLHKYLSSNPLGVTSHDKIPFHPFFSWKDILGALVMMTSLLSLCLSYPYVFMDPDNFSMANPLVTPPHIQPEWYFLFAYAILRTIPNKLGGVLALISSILIMAILPLIKSSYKSKNLEYKMITKTLFFLWTWNLLYLTILGAMPIEAPFLTISWFSTSFYFLFFIIM